MDRFINSLLGHRLYPVTSSLFIVFFLIIFLPFDISRTKTQTLFLDLVVIGSVHTILLVLYRAYFSRTKFELQRYHELILLIPFFLATACISMFIHVLLGISVLNSSFALKWIYCSLLVLPIPHILSLASFKKSILFDHSNHKFEGIYLNEIFYMHALGNYVEVVYSEGKVVRKKIIRSTLSSLETLLNTQFIRCHRSYLVNSSQKMLLKGNARSYKLSIITDGTEMQIPVSTKKRQQVMTRIK